MTVVTDEVQLTLFAGDTLSTEKIRDSINDPTRLLNSRTHKLNNHKRPFPKRNPLGDFPSGPVVKTLCSQCREPGFDP